MDHELLQQLVRRIGEIEANERPLLQTAIAPAVPGLADVLPPGGLPAGSLVELLSGAEGAGAWTLALILGKQACGQRKILIVADDRRCFYPPAACKLGIDLRRTLVIRPKERGSALAALVQSLRCPAVGAALGSFERLNAVEYRSLQLAAETGGGVGLIVRPAPVRAGPCFAAVRLLVTPLPLVTGEGKSAGAESCRHIQIEVLRLRGGKAGRRLVLEVDHETGDVRVPAALAAAKTAARKARAAE
jgi:protein ImuA